MHTMMLMVPFAVSGVSLSCQRQGGWVLRICAADGKYTNTCALTHVHPTPL